MIQWSKYGTIHVGTTDCGLRFVVKRWHDARCYEMSVQNSEGKQIERTIGHASVRAAKVAAMVTEAGLRKAVQS